MKLPSLGIRKQSCCNTSTITCEGLEKIILVGSPNVGKSVLFNILSDSYAIASNYPGTTVEISSGKGWIGGTEYEIIDTPGMYALLPITEEERVAQKILFNERPKVYLHVVDAKNLGRMLPMTMQLIEAGVPLILVLNIMDEAAARGVHINAQKLSQMLNIPVVCTVSTREVGIDELEQAVSDYEQQTPGHRLGYNADIESALRNIETYLTDVQGISRRSQALLLLQNDTVALERINEESRSAIHSIVDDTARQFAYPLNYVITFERQKQADRVSDQVISKTDEIDMKRWTGNASYGKQRSGLLLGKRIDRLFTRPLTGIPILFFVLYFGLYQFVGVFTAGTVVDYLENTLFGEQINPWIIETFKAIIPFAAVQDLFVGEYGILTQAVTYAIALIMPLVGAFFIVFSIIEDTGYLPRLAMLIDRVFKKIGLSGRAVIPMVLGFGCDTMATMVTRTLNTKREKVISSLLLALAIPCSAQLGVILAILSERPLGLLIWALVIMMEFVFIGYLATKILPGKKPSFIMELPPLRLPKLSNVVIKTYSRMHWYFFEVLPLFVVASILIWIGQLTGLFNLAVRMFEYPTQWIGLPAEASVVFLFGFFRRDFGAAGLFEMNDAGILTGVQLVVAAVTLTLFIPCVAQFMMTVKERGVKTALAMGAFIFPSAFVVGFLVNSVLTTLGVTL
ncbi:MAG: ferrous iron transport protein B [ANME-2 cluster archaeon]|nr:ferrous iron transport protein B [ANME-2 cluster archaeon]